MSDSQTDSDDLLDAIMPIAFQALSKYGEFAPVGLALNGVGEIIMVAAGDDPGGEAPDTVGLMEIIRDGFIEGARSGEYRATALAYEATVTLPQSGRKADAIAVAFDHRDGSSSIAYFPFELDGSKVQVDEEGAVAERGEGMIFSR